MDAPQGTFSFRGITRIISGSYTMQHGTTPGVCILEIAPQADIPTTPGTLTMRFGDKTQKFPGFKVDACTLTLDDERRVIQCRLLDFRWTWQWGQISGFYNTPRPNGTIPDDRNVTPQDLCSLCLQAMGVQEYLVDQVPNFARPQVEWEVDNPGQALQSLCDTLGCRIVPFFQGGVNVAPSGVGADLPRGGVMDVTGTMDPPEPPQSIACITAPIRFQTDLLLEPVGQNIDGNIVPIDELDYVPDAGWDTDDGGFDHTFGSLRQRDSVAAVKQAELAASCVMKWFRIVTPCDLPVVGEIDDLRLILPIQAGQVLTQSQHLADGVDYIDSQPALVWGAFYRQNLLPPNDLANSTKVANKFSNDLTYQREFLIDTTNGVVKFNDYVLYMAGNQNLIRPDLRLRCAVTVRDPKSRAWLRFFLAREIGDFTTPARYIRREDIIPAVYFDNDGNIVNNQQAVETQCSYYLDAAEQEYEQTTPQSASYAGLRFDVPLDGAIQSITWSVGTPFAVTRISRNDERTSPATMPYNMRVQLQRTRNSEKKAAAEALKPRAG